MNRWPTLCRQKFDGNIAIKYDCDWQHSAPCIGFVRGWAAANPS